MKALWELRQAGDPPRVVTEHDGCGAAIQVALVGILDRSHRLDEIDAAARQASIPTHGGPQTLAAAAATAAAVSAAIDGAGPGVIVELTGRAATLAESERLGSMAVGFAPALRAVHAHLRRRPELRAADVAVTYDPNAPLTIVPLAIALATVVDSAERAILLAANIGGDSDSVASIAGAILGARYPGTVNEEWYAVVERVNGRGLVALGDAPAALRA